MLEKIKDYLARSVYAIPVLTAIFILVGFMGAGAYYIYKKKPNLNAVKEIAKENITNMENDISEDLDSISETQQEALNEIGKNPPKTNSEDLSVKSVDTSAGKAVVVSTGSNGGVSDSKIQDYASYGPISNFAYIDSTGMYPNLGNVIKEHLNSKLLKGEEVSYLYELDVIDCASCNYGGYWTGSYLYSGDDIIKAYGYITLNVANYKSSPYFEDYMKLIFSHEYGHHYTMYHRWIKLDIPSGQRFPASYYSARPLSYPATAPDYSKGWENCDAEVIAEDYSYFYSGYAYSGVAEAHGYPSVAIKTWLVNLSGTTPPAEPESPPADTIVPTVAIISPENDAEISGNIAVAFSASDNVAVSKVELYINDSLFGADHSSPFQITWQTLSVENGVYNLSAKAYDSSGNFSVASISVTVSNSNPEDDINPQVSITAPIINPYSWLAEDLLISAEAQDNLAVVKLEFYINGTLVASENNSIINRLWRYEPTPVGSYELMAKAYDAANNSASASIIINRN